MAEKSEKKRLAILRIVQASNKPIPSQNITEQLQSIGYDISERTVRFHLLNMDKEGLTEYVGKHGRRITDLGIKEMASARVFEKVGFLADKIDQLAYQMSFDLIRKEGTVIINVALIAKGLLTEACPLLISVFEAGYSMGSLIKLFNEGEKVGALTIPEGFAGIGTVCSISLNGVLLHQGVPVTSKFGGVLEIHNAKPLRFVEIMSYNGTSLDPLEIFIKGRMTNVVGAIKKGSGRIGASFREAPASSLPQIQDINDKLYKTGLGHFLKIGLPNQGLYDIPIHEGRVGAIVSGGLNPIACLMENDINVELHALSGLLDFHELFPYSELGSRASHILS